MDNKTFEEKTFRKEARCPCCNNLMDAHTVVSTDNKYQPSPGDVSICFYCGAINLYDEELNIKIMTEEEQRKYSKSDPDQWQFVLYAREELRKVSEKLKQKK